MPFILKNKSVGVNLQSNFTSNDSSLSRAICADFQRSLGPLFSNVSLSDDQEATVPHTEKSPLTCIRSKLPCDREVPQSDSAVRFLLSSGHSFLRRFCNTKTGPKTEETSLDVELHRRNT